MRSLDLTSFKLDELGADSVTLGLRTRTRGSGLEVVGSTITPPGSFLMVGEGAASNSLRVEASPGVEVSLGAEASSEVEVGLGVEASSGVEVGLGVEASSGVED